jgi:hypothetical protein
MVQPIDPRSNIYHNFVQAQAVANAGQNHTAFTVDAEVHYDGDCDAMRADVGQYATQPV